MNRDVRIIRSKRKTLSVEVKPGGEIVARAPNKMKLDYIEAYIVKIEPWLETAVEKQKKKQVKIYTDIEIENMRVAAKNVIPLRVKYFSECMGLEPTGIKITSARKRFGSCSSKNSLCFSLFLMDKSPEQIDAVIVHELAHIKEKNHGKNFYRLIESYMPDYKKRIRELNM